MSTSSKQITSGMRVREARNKKNLSQQSFAESIGISRGYLNDIERGRQKPSYNVITALSEVYNFSIDWILTGEGHMYRPPQTEPQPAEDVQKPSLTEREKDMLMIFRELPEMEQNEILQISRKEKELAELRKRIEKLERKAG